jgi:hypothetical protein
MNARRAAAPSVALLAALASIPSIACSSSDTIHIPDAPDGSIGATDGGSTDAAHDGAVGNKDGSAGKDATPGTDSGGGTDAGGDDDDGSASDGATADAAPDSGSAFTSPGQDANVVAFDQTLVCFGNGGVGPCSRTVDSQVTFPATGTYSKITMHLSLDCPSNGCDPWDRVGSIYAVQPASGGNETLLEIGRFMTPYGISNGVNSPPKWDVDVTELRPLLAGGVTLRVFIDTWVPQGNAAAYGGGWVFGASFEMKGGTPTKSPQVVLPLWVWKTNGKEPTQVVYGDARWPIASSVPAQKIDLPGGMTSWGIRAHITGHGQANLDNCAEFCSRNHGWTVGSQANTKAIWRTDCGNFPSNGTYQYSRAGWCPGASVDPWDIDVSSQVSASGKTTFTYGVDDYLNTCNGDAPNGGICTGCNGGTCGYNGGSHTQPFYYLSSLLIGFK